jgi:drug/metabolite transporter (DMT)-like permease
MHNIRGILLMTLSMALFAAEDAFIKALTHSFSTGQVLIMAGLGGAAIFGGIAISKNQSLLAPLVTSPTLLIRTLSEAVGAMLFVSALAQVPMSSAAAVFQALPLAITLAAALFLKEQVGWRRWSAITVGFLGVLLIIRPGLAGFNPATFLVLGAVAAIATRDLISRKLPTDISSYVVSFHGFAAVIPAGAFLMLLGADHPQTVNLQEFAQVTGAVIFGVLGYLAIVISTRTGEASAITPFRYTRLIFSMLLGMIVFAERPDLMTYAGSVLIIGSGLYSFVRERRLAQRAAPGISA